MRKKSTVMMMVVVMKRKKKEEEGEENDDDDDDAEEYSPRYNLTHCGRVTQICVFNTVKLGTSASSP